MERRFQARLDELRDDAQVRPGLLRGMLPRLEAFLEPFVRSLCCPEQRTNAHHYVSGLLSDLESKDAESIAYLHDRERQGLQKFIGQAPWDHKPLIAELARQVGQRLGEPAGVLVFDPSAFVKQGKSTRSQGEPWSRVGEIDRIGPCCRSAW
jgi:SRSO17 transposase